MSRRADGSTAPSLQRFTAAVARLAAVVLPRCGVEVGDLRSPSRPARFWAWRCRLIHFTEGSICFPRKRLMSELLPDEIGPSDWCTRIAIGSGVLVVEVLSGRA
jgi:hypothetical protein